MKKVISLLLCMSVLTVTTACSDNKDTNKDLVVTNIGESITTTTAKPLKGIGINNKETLTLTYKKLTTIETDNSTVYVVLFNSKDLTIVDSIFNNASDCVKDVYSFKGGNGKYVCVYELQKSRPLELEAGDNSLYKIVLKEDNSLVNELGDSLTVTGSELERDAIFDDSVENGEYLYDEFTGTITVTAVNIDNILDTLTRLKGSLTDKSNSIEVIEVEDGISNDVRYSRYTIKYTAHYYVGSITAEEAEMTLGVSNFVNSNDVVNYANEEYDEILKTINNGVSTKTPQEILESAIKNTDITEVTE